MISIRNLTKRYGATDALKGISLDVRAGELFGYLGPNGSGKTTTINILTGLTAPTSGAALLAGVDMATDPVNAKRVNGLVPQSLNLDGELTLFENLMIHGRLFGMARRDYLARIDELLDYVEMTGKRDALVKTLSGGQKRRVMIARALLHRPSILFLDEPTVGLDPSIRRRIWSLIRQTQKDGATIFLTTHYIEEAEFLADRVAFLVEGEVAAVDTPHALMARLGEWALDEMRDGDLATRYFADKQQAHDAADANAGSYTVRRVNLEDAFIALTGAKVTGDAPKGNGHGK
ncbi:MAG: ABC transporter ATP-binding protein [Nitrospinae bacterium]|nr:ABC transporter ATP-binding protein [Nitrospinota bacterium]